MARSFSSLRAFREHLAEVIASAPMAERCAAEAGSDHFLGAVKGIVGNYQSDPVQWSGAA